MRRLFLISITPAVGCATVMEANTIFRTGSTGLLNETAIVKTFETLANQPNFPLSIKMPDDFDGYRYVTLIVSNTKNTGGWTVVPNLIDTKLNYCIKGPAPMSAVTTALSTPYLIVAHNKRLEIREAVSCD